MACGDEVRGVVHAVVEFSRGHASCRSEFVRLAVPTVLVRIAAADVVRRACGCGKSCVLLPRRATGAARDRLDENDVAERESSELKEEQRTRRRVLDADVERVSPGVRRRVAVLFDGGAPLAEVRVAGFDMRAVPPRAARRGRQRATGGQEGEVIRGREDGSGSDVSGDGLPELVLGYRVVRYAAGRSEQFIGCVFRGPVQGAASVALAVGCVTGRCVGRPSDEAVRGCGDVLHGGELERDAEVGRDAFGAVGAPSGARDSLRELGALRGLTTEELGGGAEVPCHLGGLERDNAAVLLGAPWPLDQRHARRMGQGRVARALDRLGDAGGDLRRFVLLSRVVGRVFGDAPVALSDAREVVHDELRRR